MWYFKTIVLSLLLLNFGLAKSQLSADFEVDFNEGCTPLVVTFTNLTPHNPDNEYYWDFGNGNTSELQNPSSIYSEAGTYNVQLKVVNKGVEQIVLKNDLINVFSPEVIDILINTPTEGCAPHEVSFEVIGDGDMINPSYTWDFGDGKLSSDPAPVNTYTEAGLYDVTLIIDYNTGCVSKITKEELLKVNNPRAFFNSDNTSACNGTFTTVFNNQSYGSDDLNYHWKFGDGAISAESNPAHTYDEPGSYTVVLTVTDPIGCTDSLVQEQFINVEETKSQFTTEKDVFCPNEPITFVNTSINNKFNVWDFGDGNGSSLESPVHRFTSPGEYIVKLVIENGICTNEYSKTITIEEVIADFEISDDYGCSFPFTVEYINKSTNAINYEWEFDNETSSDLANPSVTYTSFKPGANSSVETYSTKLTAISANGCKNTREIKDILTISLPVARITSNQLLGCIPLEVNLESSSTYVSEQDQITSYQWLLNGEEVSTESSWTNTFTEATEEEKIELLITTGLGCVSKINDVIKAGKTQEPDFAVKDKSVYCASETVEFIDLSSNKQEIDFIEWNYGDGTKSFVGELTHVYNDIGTFDVELSVFHNGCKTSVTKTEAVTINGPIIDFNRLNKCENVMTAQLVADLKDASGFEWDFGDGSDKVSGEESVNHTYSEEGTYQITLKADNATHGCNAETTKEITIIKSLAVLTVSKDSCCIKESIEFDPLSSINAAEFDKGGNSYKYVFDFGDGAEPAYTSAVADNSYASAGKYLAKLIIEDVNNCTDTAQQIVEVFDINPDFNYQYDNGCLPAQYSFFDQTVSDIPVVQWEWSFGDGTTSTEKDPKHVVNNFGIYDIQLTTINKIGCSGTISKTDELVLREPVPVIKSENSKTCVNSVVSFEEASFTNITQYNWDFGDGGTSTEETPSHTYENTGLYDVSLTITDNHGCIGTTTNAEYVSVQDYPVAAFTSDKTVSNCYPFKVEFSDLSTGESLSNWYWNFGDNGEAATQNPQHIYTKPGLYDVQLIAATSNACQDTIKKMAIIEVNGPYAEIMVSDTVCLNTDVEFSLVNIQNVESALWDFGDGNISNALNTVHQYQLNGTKYPTTLLVNSGSFACNKYINDTLYVDEVEALFAFGDEKGIGCEPYELNLINNSYRANKTAWSVNDEIISEANETSHVYSTDGLYKTGLHVTSSNGCKDSIEAFVTVHPLPTIELIRDTFICKGNDIMLWAKGGSLYSWSPSVSLDHADIDIPIANPVITTAYTVQVTDDNECINNGSVKITVQQPPFIELKDSTIIIGESIDYNIKDESIKTYEWSPDVEISDASSPIITILPTESRTYNVALTDTAECFTETFSLNINVEKKYSVDVPTAFTPNGDQVNDQIGVKGWGIKELKYFRVFNRFGSMVFETNDLEIGWDGKFKGVDQEAGIYNYIVSVISYDNKVREIKGAFELIK